MPFCSGLYLLYVMNALLVVFSEASLSSGSIVKPDPPSLLTIAVYFREALNPWLRKTSVRHLVCKALQDGSYTCAHTNTFNPIPYIRRTEACARNMLTNSSYTLINTHLLHHHLRSILCDSFQSHPTSWQALFLPLPLENKLPLLIQSRIEILQAYLHVRPHTHKRHRHTAAHSLWTCFLLFACQQQNKNKIEGRSERRSVEGREWGGGRERRTYLH